MCSTNGMLQDQSTSPPVPWRRLCCPFSHPFVQTVDRDLDRPGRLRTVRLAETLLGPIDLGIRFEGSRAARLGTGRRCVFVRIRFVRSLPVSFFAGRTARSFFDRFRVTRCDI